MKTKFLVTNLWLITILVTAGCSSQNGEQTQDGQGDEPINNTDNLNSNENVNNASLNGNGQGGNAAQGEGLNNAVDQGENYGNNSGGNNAGGSNLIGNNMPSNPLAGNPSGNPFANPAAVPLNNSVPLNAPLVNAAIPTNSLPTNAAPLNGVPLTDPATMPAVTEPMAPASPTAPVVSWDKMNASPFANPQMNWPGRGKVKYINRKTTKHASPNGPVVGDLNVGNHPLVYQNGNWVELSNGTFVKGETTTDRPTGYERSRSNSYSH